MREVVVSVVMPSYNSERFIAESIEAVLAQSFLQWELIVVDDCSSDSTVEIVKGYSLKDSRIVLIENRENSGAAHSRNRAIAAARGRYIAFCDSDDTWHSEKLSRQVAFMRSFSPPLSYHNYEVIDSDGVVRKVRKSPDKITYNSLLKRCEIGCLTAMYDTKITGKVYCPEIRKRQDWALWLAITREFGAARGMGEMLGSYRVGHGSISSSKLKLVKANYRVFRRVEGFNIFFSTLLISRFLFYHLLRMARGEV